MNESVRRPIPLVLFVTPVLVLALIVLAVGWYAVDRAKAPSCDPYTIGTWHDGPRSYALLHDFGPVTDFTVIGSAGEGQQSQPLTWEIRPVGVARVLATIELGTVPQGYRQVGSDRLSSLFGSFLLAAIGSGGRTAGGVGNANDPQHQARVGGIIAGQRDAAARCYSVP